MSREKQIEEMIEIVKPFVSGLACEQESGSCELTDCRSCKARCIANALIEKGYRKQSEWISVEERLPTREDGKVLIYTPYGISIAQKTTTNHWKGDNAIPKLITHWMPLPEAPKGGAE